MVKMIGIIRVQHGAVGDRQREVHGPATAGVMGEIQRRNAARIVEARIIGDAEIVPLACDHHVVVAVIAHFAGRDRVPCRDGAGHGQRVALALFPAKAAAHAPRLHAHGVHGSAEGLSDLVLDFGGVLGRAVDEHVTALKRQGEGGLTLQIKVFLTADLE